MALKERGNAAAMREALVAVKKSIDGIGTSSLDCDPEIIIASLTQVCARLSARIDKAMSKPPRNCDRFKTADEAWNAYDEWVESFRVNRRMPPYNVFGWLFAPVEERKGDGDGK
jgi:hypothetical protein